VIDGERPPLDDQIERLVQAKMVCALLDVGSMVGEPLSVPPEKTEAWDALRAHNAQLLRVAREMEELLKQF
jgi:hypothetical protein